MLGRNIFSLTPRASTLERIEDVYKRQQLRRYLGMRLTVSLWAVALVVCPVYAQLPAPSSTTPVSPPVGQGINDWAYIGRYRDANQPLIADPGSARVVFMGDSITEGWARQPFIKDNPKYVGREMCIRDRKPPTRWERFGPRRPG